MTANKTIYKKSISFSNFVAAAMVCFTFALFFRNSQIALDYIKNGLLLCASTIIPSLFPFMVLSEIAISAGVGEMLAKYLGGPMSRLFGISGEGACAFLLGILCGFPVGAKSAVSLYDKGKISKQECEKLLSICNIPSMSFVVNIVGISLFGRASVGWIFWLSALFSSVIVGIIGNVISKKQEPMPLALSENPAPQANFRATDFVRAVEGSTKSTLIICAYVIFFSALMGTAEAPLEFFRIPQLPKIAFSGFLELTTGVARCVDIASLPLRAAFCALFVGWSGLSVHFQIFSICDGRGLHFKNYLLMKLLQALICPVVSCLALSLVF